jgi:hypothetical protein
MKKYLNMHPYNPKVGDADRKTVNDSTPPVIPNYDSAELDEKTRELIRKTKRELE